MDSIVTQLLLEAFTRLQKLVQHLVVQALQFDHLLPGGGAPARSARGRRGGGGGGCAAAIMDDLVGEVEHGEGAPHLEGGLVVGTGGLLGGAEGAEPDAGAVPTGVTDLRRILPPRPASDAAVLGLVALLPLSASSHAGGQLTVEGGFGLPGGLRLGGKRWVQRKNVGSSPTAAASNRNQTVQILRHANRRL
ncbi:unnamed protein product [Musa acuminata subsp. malaccensis]|uniref:(wild Malaysian banana) hypothetical protein n=1 Tax=Musa acuminata subsp. malaccensis TaxID=214687 RepID=A0A8D7A2Z9_MUSAM|nr:unnamed protein product [Musa acuminata subsp. malaccensis]